MLRTFSLLVLAPCLAGQVEWTPTYGGRANHVVFHDAVRDVTVLFGGNSGGAVRADAWELPASASAWTGLELQNGPEALEGHAIAYDTLRNQAVMFGGLTANAVVKNTTWIWDGGGVNGPPVVTRPDPRWRHAMAYDEARGKIVLFGGLGSASQALGDTWEWDGTDWTMRFPQSAPSPRWFHAMAYDSSNQMVVLFGGWLGNDLWGWNGNDWVLLHNGAGTGAPGVRSGTSLARDPTSGGVVLFSGHSHPSELADTWVWSGSTWTQKQPTNIPRRRYASSAAYVPSTGKVLLAGGQFSDPYFHWTDAGAASDVWEWDGSDWHQRIPQTTPLMRASLTLAFDDRRGRVVMFGIVVGEITATTLELWEWDGAGWLERTTPGPAPVQLHAMAFDRQRGRSILTGGRQINSTLDPSDDVWAWDGTTMQRLPDLPAARYGHALAYDAHRDLIVLFGGRDRTVHHTQTWEASGSAGTWSVRSPSISPPFKDVAYMTYDEARRRTLLLTRGATGIEHWEWDGSDWRRVQPTTPPPFGPVTYDGARARIVASQSDFVWEWDGNDWSQRIEVPPTQLRMLAYDSTRAKVVAVDGDTSVWYFGSTHVAAYATFGTGCAGSAGIPELRGAQLPWVGCPFSLEFDNLPAQPGIVWIGFSNSLWNTLPLPFDLSQIGLTGCLLYTGIVNSFPIANNAWSFNIPNLASLLGGVFYNQALILDPGTNPFGAVVTNAGEAVIGGK